MLRRKAVFERILTGLIIAAGVATTCGIVGVAVAQKRATSVWDQLKTRTMPRLNARAVRACCIFQTTARWAQYSFRMRACEAHRGFLSLDK